jgi:hypothetical protein
MVVLVQAHMVVAVVVDIIKPLLYHRYNKNHSFINQNLSFYDLFTFTNTTFSTKLFYETSFKRLYIIILNFYYTFYIFFVFIEMSFYYLNKNKKNYSFGKFPFWARSSWKKVSEFQNENPILALSHN